MKALSACYNGDGRPVQPPSAVLCRECLDEIETKVKAMLIRLAPRGGAAAFSECCSASLSEDGAHCTLCGLSTRFLREDATMRNPFTEDARWADQRCMTCDKPLDRRGALCRSCYVEAWKDEYEDDGGRG